MGRNFPGGPLIVRSMGRAIVRALVVAGLTACLGLDAAGADPGGTVEVGASGPAIAVAVDATGVAVIGTSVDRRTYTQTGESVAMTGSPVALGASHVRQIDRDAGRTAFVDAEGDLWLVADDGTRTLVYEATDRVGRVADSAGLELSGTRLLWARASYTGSFCDDGCADGYFEITPMLYDLRTGRNVELELPAGPWEARALWGGYLAYEGNLNTIWRKDLTTGKVIQVKPAGREPVTSLAAHDDYVAWSTCTPGFATRCSQSSVAYRNLSTGTRVTVETADTSKVRLSSGHLQYDESTAPGQRPMLKVLRLGTRVTAEVGPLADRAFDVYDETLAWVAPDGKARLAPNSAFTAAPRYLGNALGPHTVPSGHPWTVEFPVSKRLTTCTLTITTPSTVIRELSWGATGVYIVPPHERRRLCQADIRTDIGAAG